MAFGGHVQPRSTTPNPSASKELAWDCWELPCLFTENAGARVGHGANPERSVALSTSALTRPLQLNCGTVFLHRAHQAVSGKSPFILGAVPRPQCHLGRPVTCQAPRSLDTALIKTDKNPFSPRVYLLEEWRSTST